MLSAVLLIDVLLYVIVLSVSMVIVVILGVFIMSVLKLCGGLLQ
jgi:hypothetical protein